MRPRNFYEGGSTSGQHPARRRLELFVAPTAADDFNAIRLPLVVVACWRLNHVLFDFDSSFVAPETKAELLLLSRTIDANPGSPMAIFGHADPTGDDEYNKRLSGRRARAVHAVLTRDIAAWEDLFSNPTGGDTWGLRSTQRILGFLRREDGDGPYLSEKATGTFDGATHDAIRAFQADHGLTVDGIAGPHTRKALYRDYMDAICVGRDRQLVLDNDDFVVGEGAKNGDGAFQGCGEFNPVHLLSKAMDVDPAFLLFLLPAVVFGVHYFRENKFDVFPIYFALVLLVTTVIFGSPGIGINHLFDLQIAAVLLLAVAISRAPAFTEIGTGFLAFALIVAMVPTSQSLHGDLTRPSFRRDTAEVLDRLPADSRPILAENPLIVVNSGKAPYLLDPFMFRILAIKHPELVGDFWEKIKRQGFAAIVLERNPATAEGKTWYTDTHFGGEFLRDLDAHYALSFATAKSYVYTPKAAQP